MAQDKIEPQFDFGELSPKMQLTVILGVVRLAEDYVALASVNLVAGVMVADYLRDAREALEIELRYHDN